MEKLLVYFLIKAGLVNMSFILMEQLMFSSAKKCRVEMLELSFYTKKNIVQSAPPLSYFIVLYRTRANKGTFSFFLCGG